MRSAFTWRHALERFETIYDELLGLAGFTPDSGRRRTGPEPAADEPRGPHR